MKVIQALGLVVAAFASSVSATPYTFTTLDVPGASFTQARVASITPARWWGFSATAAANTDLWRRPSRCRLQYGYWAPHWVVWG